MSDGICDFDKLESLKGVYFANVFDSEKVEQLREYSKELSNSINSYTDKNKKEASYYDLENYKQTVVSFDKGGIWEPI